MQSILILVALVQRLEIRGVDDECCWPKPGAVNNTGVDVSNARQLAGKACDTSPVSEIAYKPVYRQGEDFRQNHYNAW